MNVGNCNFDLTLVDVQVDYQRRHPEKDWYYVQVKYMDLSRPSKREVDLTEHLETWQEVQEFLTSLPKTTRVDI